MGLFSRSSAPAHETTSMRNKRAFCNYLDNRGSHWSNFEGDETTVKMKYGGGDFVFTELTAYIDFDPNSSGNGDTVQVVIPQVARYSGSARERGLELCNKIANEHRWIRAYVDNDDDLMIDADMYITGGEFLEDVRSLVAIMMSVIDDVYQDIQRTQWA